jgi:hypothetical protein
MSELVLEKPETAMINVSEMVLFIAALELENATLKRELEGLKAAIREIGR